MKNIRHCGIVITDIDRADYFYKQLLGLKLIDNAIETGNYIKNLLGFSTLNWTKYTTDDGDILELYHIPDYDVHPSINSLNHVAFTVKDLRKVSDKLVRNDISCSNIEINKYKTCKVMFCRDPFNNLLELVEEIK